MGKIINSVIRLTNRQYGKYYENSYDNSLARLMVRPWDNWRGINPAGVGGFNLDLPIFAAKFALSENYNHILAIANEDGRIALQNTFVKKTITEDLSLEGDQCHFNAVFDISWMPHHLKLISASGDHTARLWDVSTSKLMSIREFNGHSRSVKVATFPHNNCNLFATGGRDGQVIIWDIRTQDNHEIVQHSSNIEDRIQNAHVGCGTGPATPSSRRRTTRNATPKVPANISNSSVTGLAFQNDYTLISCGPGDGFIKAWDLRRCYSTLKREPIAKYNIPYAGSSTLKGFTNLVVNDDGTRLYASCMDSNIYCYNISTYSKEPIMIYAGAQIKSFYIKSCLSPDNQYLLSGSCDEKAYIWNVENPVPLVTLKGHLCEVTSVAWSNHQNNLDGGNISIVTCSDDACHKIWRIGPNELPKDEEVLLRGKGELNPEYYASYKVKQQLPIRQQFKLLESTPRSIRRLIEKRETTPTTTMTSSLTKDNTVSPASVSTGRKRSFNEACEGDNDILRSEIKRPNLETRGRRLFSPKNVDNDIIFDGPSKSLTTILEELDTPRSSNFKNHSPSPVKKQLNILSSPEPLRFTSPPKQRDFSVLMLNSPTTNLPNYVLDPQEAPHLTNLISPQRKIKKENVDWLTKMRKQKLLSLNIGVEKSQHLSSLHVEHNLNDNGDKLKSIENKTEASEAKPVQKRHGTSILNFFAVKQTKVPPENV